MKVEEALVAYRNGGKIRRVTWGQGVYFNDFEHLTHRDVMAEDWKVLDLDPKPPKLMAPAFFALDEGYCVSGMLFSSEEDAQARCIGRNIKWPAIPDANGFYSVPQE